MLRPNGNPQPIPSTTSLPHPKGLTNRKPSTESPSATHRSTPRRDGVVWWFPISRIAILLWPHRIPNLRHDSCHHRKGSQISHVKTHTHPQEKSMACRGWHAMQRVRNYSQFNTIVHRARRGSHQLRQQLGLTRHWPDYQQPDPHCPVAAEPRLSATAGPSSSWGRGNPHPRDPPR